MEDGVTFVRAQIYGVNSILTYLNIAQHSSANPEARNATSREFFKLSVSLYHLAQEIPFSLRSVWPRATTFTNRDMSHM